MSSVFQGNKKLVLCFIYSHSSKILILYYKHISLSSPQTKMFLPSHRSSTDKSCENFICQTNLCCNYCGMASNLIYFYFCAKSVLSKDIFQAHCAVKSEILDITNVFKRKKIILLSPPLQG